MPMQMRPDQQALFQQQESFRQLNELLLQPQTPQSDAYSHPLEANSPYGPPFPGLTTISDHLQLVTELMKPLVFTNANLTNLTQTPC
ncbi:hypothetical protein PtA15_13A302 [Puccinia triticina]|uniref:Uncharacterized protein n=1 Tax=Puccinia triticina TaxID=208348 RepID=A0ABY7D3Q1_9BASI|nr:uncharacterized protein PtA15_13A302 [Puccinia triticina]WAQ90902.1 hypothetical protein PtA15_13A302 [Puccinia triticina]